VAVYLVFTPTVEKSKEAKLPLASEVKVAGLVEPPPRGGSTM